MISTTAQAAALALSALVALGVVAGANGIATKQYSAAERVALAPYGQMHVAMQRVVVIGRRANA